VDRFGVGLPAQIVRAGDKRIEPRAQVELVDDLVREERRAVGDDADRDAGGVELVEQRRGVVVDVRRLGAGAGILGLV
jgi:hypothetical protein